MISAAYAQAKTLCLQDASEPLRIQVAKDRLIDLRPIMVGMEYDSIPQVYTEIWANAMREIDEELDSLYRRSLNA